MDNVATTTDMGSTPPERMSFRINNARPFGVNAPTRAIQSGIAKHDIAHLLRQRETLLWVFVMPALFFYFIGTVTGGMAPSGTSAPTPLALEVPGANGGFLLEQLTERLRRENFEIVSDADTTLVVASESFSQDLLSGKQVAMK